LCICKSLWVLGAKLNFQSPEVEEVLLRHTVCVGGTFQIVSDVYAEEFEACSLVGIHAYYCCVVCKLGD
jgi:hypothetical protein